MNISGVKPEDIVECEVRGDRFFANAIGKTDRLENGQKGKGLKVSSLTGRPIPARIVTSRQVLRHWRKSKQSKF